MNFTDMESRFPAPYKIVYPNISDATTVSEIAAGQEYEAVSIGPQSEVAACYLLTNGKTLPPASALTGLQGVQNNIFDDPDIIKISTNSPYTGLVKGPIKVVPAYAQVSYNAIYGKLNSTVYPQKLELLFHKRAPFWFPTSRPDAIYNQYENDISGTVAQALLHIVPGQGRSEQLFSLYVNGMTGGALTYVVKGAKVNGLLQGGYIDLSELVSAAITADGSYIYEYEGKFDFYLVYLTSASVTTGGSAVALSSVTVRG